MSRTSVDKAAIFGTLIRAMHILSKQLSRDLTRPGAKKRVKVENDAPRKVFTAKTDGAVLEFSHKQADLAFWVGKKHYGSGQSSRIRIRRTQEAATNDA